MEKNLDQIKGKLRIRIACGTADNGHLPTVRDFHAALQKHGISHDYTELEGLGHQRTKMIQILEKSWFSFHVESLRIAGGLDEG